MLEGSILHQLAEKQQSSDSASSQLNFGVYYKHTLVALCHALEDCILATQDKPLVVTAFQQGKWYLQEAERYSAIADCAQHITIMATPGSGFHEHPTSQRDNVTLVDLKPDDPVAQEWHLIILSPEYTAMVLCQELSPEEYGPEGTPDEDLARKFYGFWTFEPELVLETVKLAIAHIGTYNSDLQQQLNQAVEQFTVNLQSDNPPQTLEMSDVVAQVVQYLQTSRSELGHADLIAYTQALDYNLVSNELQAFLRLAQLVDLSDPTNPGGAGEVAALAEMMGQLIDMPAWQLKRLRLASVLHRIAPVQSIDSLTEEAGPSCRLNPGVQALRTMPRLRAVAEIITHQHEWWNGTGQPAKLEGDAIPLESRILALASHFQTVAAQHQSSKATAVLSSEASDHLTAALEVCQAQQGERWDPKLVDLLSLLVQGIQQGLSLPSIPPKFTAGVGLLDPDTSNQAATSTTSA